jgi:hypothetical protein
MSADVSSSVVASTRVKGPETCFHHVGVGHPHLRSEDGQTLGHSSGR